MKRISLVALSIACLSAAGAQLFGAVSAQAQTAATAPLGQADDGTFKSADLNNDGKVTRPEIVHFTDLVFLSMDADGNEQLTFEEFAAWDTGYNQVAALAGKERAFQDAKRALFAELDLNRDGKVAFEEMSASSLYHFYKADVNRNGSLDRVEFTTELLIPKTLREAAQ